MAEALPGTMDSVCRHAPYVLRDWLHAAEEAATDAVEWLCAGLHALGPRYDYAKTVLFISLQKVLYNMHLIGRQLKPVFDDTAAHFKALPSTLQLYATWSMYSLSHLSLATVLALAQLVSLTHSACLALRTWFRDVTAEDLKLGLVQLENALVDVAIVIGLRGVLLSQTCAIAVLRGMERTGAVIFWVTYGLLEFVGFIPLSILKALWATLLALLFTLHEGWVWLNPLVA